MMLAAVSLWRREVVRFLRDRSRVFGSLVQPLLFWVLLAAALGSEATSFKAGDVDLEKVGYGEYLVAGVLAMIVMFTSIFSTITVIEDRREGFLQGVLIAPVPRAAIALGKIAGGVTLALLNSMIFLCLAPLVGVPLTLSGAAFSILALVTISFGLVGLGFTLAWRMESTAGYHGIMMVFLMPMWMLSGALFPVQSAHPVLAFIMELNPLTYGVATLRHTMHGADAAALGLPSPVLAWGVTIGFGLGMFLLATWITTRRRAADSR
ncbi:MAG: ABC transporter permease [Planctomycetota bacterium]|jgi:ABC-2 type transport system permease protein|nr:ABC transporter permease [Planctomycetota bacterium]